MRHLILFLFLFSCLPGFSQSDDLQIFALKKELTDNANAIIRLDEMIVDIVSKKEMVLKRKKIVTVLNEAGNKHAAAFVGYDDGKKVKNIHAKVYDALGNELEKIKEKDFKDVSAVDGGTLYTDYRYIYYPYTPVSYPYTLELEYEISTKNTGELPAAWTFLDDFLVSTEVSSIQVNFASPELKPEIKELRLENLDIEKEVTANSIQYSAKNIPAIKNESLCPSFSELAPLLRLRPVNFYYEGYDASIHSWKDLGVWMSSNLLKGRDELSPVTIREVQNLVKDVDGTLEKAQIVYEYVQKNTRYISVQVGIGGMQPISAIDVDRVKYGDCKGLSNYTMALLKTVGVEAFYAHVQAGNEQVDFEDDFPDLAQGNHVILAIPHEGDYYWIDCTSQIHPFGFIGDFTDNRKAFVIKPDGGEIVRTTSYLNDQNQQLTKGDYTLQLDGSMNGKVSIITKGIQYDSHFDLSEKTEEHIKKHYKNFWDNINNLHINSYEFKNDKKEVAFREDVSISATNYASKSGDRLLFAANAFNKNKYVPGRYRNRKLPFEIQRGFYDEDQTLIKIPQGYGIESIPETMTLESTFGTYFLEIKEENGQIVLERKLLVKAGEYSATEYGAFRDFLKNISKYDNSKVVLKPIL